MSTEAIAAGSRQMATHVKFRTVTAMLRTQGTPRAGGHPESSSGPGLSTGHRPALDGLRALAVLSVIAYHLGSPWLPGGFLGVDLFFVLSGFLITSVLLDAIQRTGRVDYAAFYTRRTRRLLPAFLLLILALCGWSAFVAAPSDIGDLRGASLAALFYVANWFFILTGQSYFADQLGPSPLEHTWSLSIEEQYYLVWPLLLVLLWRSLPTKALVAFLTALIAGSVVVMAWLYSPSDPTTAYFSTFARLHELLIGSLLSAAVHKGLRFPQGLRWTSWVALGGIVLGFATMNDTSSFYYQGGSLLFSLAVAWLILTVGTGPTYATPMGFLAWKPLVWIGLISYGLYLWHWPLIVLLTPATTGLTGTPLTVLRLGLTVAIAAASYYLLEQPIRKGNIGRVSLTPRCVAVLAPLAVLTVSALVVLSTTRATPASETVNLDVTAAPTGLSGANQADLPTLAIVGDSIPTQAMAHFERAAHARNWNLLPLAYGGCSATGDYQVDANGQPFSFSERCEEVRQIQTDAIAKYTPDMVLWYSNRERWPVRANGVTLMWNTPEHRARTDAALEETYVRLTATGARVVIVMPVPKAPAVKGDCAVSPQSPECATDEKYYATFEELRDAYGDLHGRHPQTTTLVYLDDLLCPEKVNCPELTRGGAAVRPDGIHFSPEGAEWLVPLLLDRAGVRARTRQTGSEDGI